jgi:hypothetical protein
MADGQVFIGPLALPHKSAEPSNWRINMNDSFQPLKTMVSISTLGTNLTKGRLLPMAAFPIFSDEAEELAMKYCRRLHRVPVIRLLDLLAPYQSLDFCSSIGYQSSTSYLVSVKPIAYSLTQQGARSSRLESVIN